MHLSWHQALFELATGHYAQAIASYENDIRPSVVAKNLGFLADGASLMWRMKIYGDAIQNRRSRPSQSSDAFRTHLIVRLDIEDLYYFQGVESP